MAKDKKDKKPGFFDSIGTAIDQVINEVKAEVQSMTPPDDKGAKKRAAEREAKEKQLMELIGHSTAGLAESTVDDMPPDVEEPEVIEDPSAAAGAPKAPPKVEQKGMPTGNLWHALKDPAMSVRLRADACYHALTVEDIKQYAKALGDEKVAPYTLGILFVNLPGMTEEELDGDNPAAHDLLGAILLQTIANQPRLFGAIGAGPRHLWADVQRLDTHLTNLLNDNPKLIALGPIGIDEPFAPYTLPQQQEQMALQLDIAAEFQLPVMISTRKSQGRVREVLQNAQTLPQLVYLDPLLAPEDIDLVRTFNMYAVLRPEITAPTFAGAEFYRQLPLGRLLLASGSALVAPHGFSGHFNQPKFLQNTLAAAAKMFGTREPDLLATTNQNLTELFPQL